MERSSPLAAMQPTSFSFGQLSWGCNKQAANASHDLASAFGQTQNPFNFREMSLGVKRAPDYFSVRPSQGNSPTANLAVDLSQNFHIDRSPAPPTPRRSLFTTAGLLHAINIRETLSTPPPTSSSPSPLLESMEMSPLPHKVPFMTQIQIHSPTPDATPSDFHTGPEEAIIESPVDAMGPPPLPPLERRRPNPIRPILSRQKGYSTTAIGSKSAPLRPPSQPFTFTKSSSVAPPFAMTLDDCFVESPPRTGGSACLAPPIGLSRPKSAAQRTSAFAQPIGPFSAPPTRKPCAPYQRPKKQFRRSLSMFEHPEDVMQQQAQEKRAEAPALQSIMDVDEAPQLKLPHFFEDQESIPRITRETMISVLDGNFNEHYDKSMIIDCRFEYEYKGGHIADAVNFNNKEELAETLFRGDSCGRTLLIFHCEYSVHRAPLAASFIRAEDRNTNAHQYPKLNFPEVYILAGGYSAFFKEHKIRCFPQNYVEMNDKDHTNACEKGLGKIKQQRSKLGRSQTFAFGQHNQLNESPTAAGRGGCSSLMMGLDISCGDAVDSTKRLNARRMASF